MISKLKTIMVPVISLLFLLPSSSCQNNGLAANETDSDQLFEEAERKKLEDKLDAMFEEARKKEREELMSKTYTKEDMAHIDSIYTILKNANMAVTEKTRIEKYREMDWALTMDADTVRAKMKKRLEQFANE